MTTRYFAYGSNMKRQRLRQHAPSAQAIGEACLDAYEMIVNKLSSDGSTKANIVPSAAESVLGVLYDMDEGDFRQLDRNEAGYDRIKVNIRTEDGALAEAWTYISSLTDNNIEPFCWYMSYLIEGAVENNLPAAYVIRLKNIRCRKV